MLPVVDEYLCQAYGIFTDLEKYFKPSLSSMYDVIKSLPRWAVVAIAASGCTLSYYVYYEWTYGVWKRQKIPGPTPLPFMGTNHLLVHCKNLHQFNLDMARQYGQKGYFGCFNASKPTLVITDPELVKEVMVKRFETFPLRMKGFASEVKYVRKMMSTLPYDEWKRTRIAFSPSFTGARLKRMVTLMNDVGNNFSRKLSTLSAEELESVELKPFFRAYSIDIICNVVFGFKIDTQSNPDNDVAVRCFKTMSDNQEPTKLPWVVLSFLFPSLQKIFKCFSPTLGLNLDAAAMVIDQLHNIQLRRSEGKDDEERSYFLSSLIEMIDMHQKSNGSEGIEYESAVAQAVLFLLAGFDTTANLLMWSAYYLALYPELQNDIKQEIDDILGPPNKEVIFENLAKMKRIENFLLETLRLRPVFRVPREAICDTTIGPGIKIKTGTAVEVPPNVIHLDPKIWDRPNEFRPERFEPEEANKRSPYAFISFGVGPRNCIGMRLALMEAKMAVIGLLRSYKLSVAKDTPINITEFVKTQFFDQVQPMPLKLSKR